MHSWLVRKFGGTSLGNADRMVQCIMLGAEQGDSLRLVVCLSACSTPGCKSEGTTSQLLLAASLASNELDSGKESPISFNKKKKKERGWREILFDLQEFHLELADGVFDHKKISGLAKGDQTEWLALLHKALRFNLKNLIRFHFKQLIGFMEAIQVIGEMSCNSRDYVVSYGELMSCLIYQAGLEFVLASKYSNHTSNHLFSQMYSVCVPLHRLISTRNSGSTRQNPLAHNQVLQRKDWDYIKQMVAHYVIRHCYNIKPLSVNDVFPDEFLASVNHSHDDDDDTLVFRMLATSPNYGFRVAVCPGFLGNIPGGLLQVVGRGYTDFTAALIASGLKNFHCAEDMGMSAHERQENVASECALSASNNVSRTFATNHSKMGTSQNIFYQIKSPFLSFRECLLMIKQIDSSSCFIARKDPSYTPTRQSATDTETIKDNHLTHQNFSKLHSNRSVEFQMTELQIWKEVDGIFTADPRKVPSAKLLEWLFPEEVAELTYYGSEVVHPFTMEQVIRAKCCIRIKNTANPKGNGTLILPFDLSSARLFINSTQNFDNSRSNVSIDAVENGCDSKYLDSDQNDVKGGLVNVLRNDNIFKLEKSTTTYARSYHNKNLGFFGPGWQIDRIFEQIITGNRFSHQRHAATNTENSSISSNEKLLTSDHKSLATAVTLKTNVLCLNIQSNKKMHSHSFLADIFSIFDKFGLVVDLISTSEVQISTAICLDNNLKIFDSLSAQTPIPSLSTAISSPSFPSYTESQSTSIEESSNPENSTNEEYQFERRYNVKNHQAESVKTLNSSKTTSTHEIFRLNWPSIEPYDFNEDEDILGISPASNYEQTSNDIISPISNSSNGQSYLGDKNASCSIPIQEKHVRLIGSVSPDLGMMISSLSNYGTVWITPREMAILSLVGTNMRNSVGMSSRMFRQLANLGVNIEMISQGASEMNISCVVLATDAQKALCKVHDVCVIGLEE